MKIQCPVTVFHPKRNYPNIPEDGLKLAKILWRMNREVFSGHGLIIAFISNPQAIKAYHQEDSPACYCDYNPYGQEPNEGHFIIHPKLIRSFIEDQFIARRGFSFDEALVMICAHETRHRVQHLCNPKLLNQGFFRKHPFRNLAIKLPCRRSAIFGRKTFLADIKNMYPKANKEDLPKLWQIERDAEVAAHVVAAVYFGCRDWKKLKAILLAGT